MIQIRDANEGDLDALMAIYNHAVVHTAAIWNDAVVDLENRRKWLHDRRALGYPVLVAVEADDIPLGYASFGDWRAFDGFRNTVEHSVYVREDQYGKGIGRALMVALIARARSIGKHVMVAAIEGQNAGSIRLHKSLGFETVGHMPQVGMKFGRWLDLAFLQLTLDDRPHP